MSIYRCVFRYYRSFLPQTIAGLVLSLIGIALNLLKPWPFKIIVDDVLPHPGSQFYTLPHFKFSLLGLSTPDLDRGRIIVLLCLALVVIQFLWGVCNWATNYILVKVGLKALLKMRTDLYSHLQRLSLKFHDTCRSR